MFNLFGNTDDKTKDRVFCTIESEYGTYVIKNGTYRGEPARIYEVDGVKESATFFDEKKYEPVFDYIKSFTLLFRFNPSPGKMLMFGGAGFQFPKYVISHYPGIRLDVVEINPLAVELARKYFYLDDLETDYRAESSGRLRIIIDDGLEYMKKTAEKYDIIINDAYHSSRPDKGLMSPGGTRLIKEHLNPGGIYGLNLITSLSGKESMPFTLTGQSLNYIFKDVRYAVCSPDVKPESLQNIMFVCGEFLSESIA